MRVLIFICLLVVPFNGLISQEIVFEHLSSNDGLSNNLVRDIIQDDEGYLWFATSGGLNRFDGHFFDVYRPVPGDVKSLSESRLNELFLDSKGFIWARSTLGNIHRIDPKYRKVLNLKEMGIIPQGVFATGHEISRSGDIWIRMNSGLLRIYYPGGTDVFEAVYYNREHLLPGNIVNFVYPEGSGTYWIGTESGLVRLYIDEQENSTSTAEVFFNDPARSFTSVFNADSVLLFGTGSKELLVYDRSDQLFTTDSTVSSMLGGSIQVISSNHQGDILIGADNGDVIHYRPANGNYTYFPGDRIPSLDASPVSEIIADSYGLFWLVTDKRGVFQYDPVKAQFSYFGLNFENRIFLGEPDKQIIYEDSNRDLWIGINGGGLFKLNRRSNTFNQFTSQTNNFNSISSDVVLSIYEDRSKNLWIGTSFGGINKVSLRDNQFNHIQPVEHPQTGFDNYIRSVVTDPIGNIYVGSKAGKIFVYSGDRKIGTIPDDLYNPSQFSETNIYCLYFDNDHNLWVGTKGSGLYVFKSLLGYFTNLSHRDIEVVHFSYDPTDNQSLSSDNIYSIIQDVHGQYWVGNFNGGLDLLTDPFGTPSFTNFNSENASSESIVSNEVRHLKLDDANNLWIATSEGISILESAYLKAESRQFINLHPSLEDTANLSGKVVYEIMQARNNDIFVALLDGGINQLRAADFEQRQFNWIHHSNELLSPNVYSIEQDNNGDLWLGTDNGLFRLSLENEAVEKFRIKNSYLPVTFSESSSSTTNRYEMVFGTDDGFVLFHPDSIQKDSTQFPVKFSGLEINGEVITISNSQILEMGIDAQKQIALNHNQNNITIYFSVLDYHKPEAIQYSYLLEGYDNYWSKPSNVYYANYRKLPPGEYTLHVRGTNSSGVRMDDIASLDLLILPPFWQTTRGHLLILLFAVLLLGTALIIIYRQIYIQNKLKVEHAITEKRIEYYTNISHEFKTPLSLILNPAEEIINSIKSSDYAKQRGLLIRKNAIYLKRLIDQILDFRKLREGKMQLRVSEIYLIDFFREIYLVFLPLAKKLNINFIFETSVENYMGYADIRQLEKITFNLLSNALKFTPAGKTVMLAITVDEAEKKLEFRVEDQGKGIDEEDLPRIFDRFFMTKGSTGIGLFFTKEMVYLHKGEIKAMNKEEGGSSFSITIPVGQDAYSEEEIDPTRELEMAFDLTPIDDIETIISEDENEINEHRHSVSHIDTVAIIEDNEEMRKYLASELSKKYKVLKAGDGVEGYSLVAEQIPDLVLADIKMPGMDGFELTKKIKENYPTSHIPVFLLTAEASIENQIKGVRSGADDYIVKPFNLNYLLAKVDKTIAQRKILLSRYDVPTRMDGTGQEMKAGKDSAFISEVQDLISENLSNQKLNVEYLVEKMGISRTLFFKRIKNSSGFSPNEYIRKERMKKASRLLTTTDMSINEVGYAVGFSDSNYFGKTFKKHFGMTPSDYKQHQGRSPIL